MDRKRFFKTMSASAGLLAVGPSFWATACANRDGGTGPGSGPGDGMPPLDGPVLPLPRVVQPDGLTLTAALGTVPTGPEVTSPAWIYNGSLPGPTLRARRGDRVRLTLSNALDEETIAHWHGLDVPATADGHPRLAVGPGSSYAYDFTIRNRAGTYWYHPHPHQRTGVQVYRGMAGFFIVDDGEEDGLQLPSSDREVLLVIQDKRLNSSGEFVYNPAGLDFMVGYLGDRPFVNGAEFPWMRVDRTVYRLRILNGSNARIYDLALNDQTPLVAIGNDGGLLAAPQILDSVFLGPGERVDVLVDFSGANPTDVIVLQSRPFQTSGPASGQGSPMDLMRFQVSDASVDPGTIPSTLPPLPDAPPVNGVSRRTFNFTSHMGRHLVNGRSFEMERVDAQIPLGEPQVWRFTNTSPIPHPVHMHGGQFRVLTRTGGRARVFPWEGGLKDTVLLMPFESVDVSVVFPIFRGLYLLHCHNLEHEDAGMMLNFEVV